MNISVFDPCKRRSYVTGKSVLLFSQVIVVQLHMVMLCSHCFIPLQLSGMLLRNVPCTSGWSIFDVILNITTMCATGLSFLKNTGKVKSVEKNNLNCKDQIEAQ